MSQPPFFSKKRKIFDFFSFYDLIILHILIILSPTARETINQKGVWKHESQVL